MVPFVYAKDVDMIELINCTWTEGEGVFVYNLICDLIPNTTVSDLFIYYSELQKVFFESFIVQHQHLVKNVGQLTVLGHI